MKKTWRLKVVITYLDPDMAGISNESGWETNPEDLATKTLHFDDEVKAHKAFAEARKAEWEERVGEYGDPGPLRLAFAAEHKLMAEDIEGHDLGFLTALEDVLEFIEVQELFPEPPPPDLDAELKEMTLEQVFDCALSDMRFHEDISISADHALRAKHWGHIFACKNEILRRFRKK